MRPRRRRSRCRRGRQETGESAFRHECLLSAQRDGHSSTCTSVHEPHDRGAQPVACVGVCAGKGGREHASARHATGTETLARKAAAPAPDNLAREPQKRLLKVVVGLGGDVVILQVLLPVEGDLFRLHLALLHIDLVADQHDRDGLAHANLHTACVCVCV
eukprot:6203884-Pleurochrysis_carterae.AAC.1